MKAKKFLLLLCLGCLVGPNTHGQENFYDLKVSKDSSCQKNNKRLAYATLKTNLAYDAIMIPNLSYEHYLGNGYSIGATYWYTWWSSNRGENSRHRFWRSYGGEIEGRKYFGKVAKEKHLAGHHIGCFVQGYMYD